MPNLSQNLVARLAAGEDIYAIIEEALTAKLRAVLANALAREESIILYGTRAIKQRASFHRESRRVKRRRRHAHA